MLMLDYWGLIPERDKIQFRSLGDQSVITQGLLNGTVDGAFVGYTFGKILQKGVSSSGRCGETAHPLSGLWNHDAAHVDVLVTRDLGKSS